MTTTPTGRRRNGRRGWIDGEQVIWSMFGSACATEYIPRTLNALGTSIEAGVFVALQPCSGD